MDARITKAEAALLLPATTIPSRRLAEVEAIRLAAIAARDEAVADGVRRAGQAMLNAAEALVRALVTFPARIDTYRALRRLSDRELRDIGMTRFDIPRVFDPSFATRAANDSPQAPQRAA
ncbi:DUF1127 domain-containing protein [Roseomonas fluvialis]|uniref:YjiS-like domain-containing protein n=1 Tax=Roseomonas fluvialis TaxID=1750527 RepID=A0ABM7XZY8_9PROT|nr:DUF1127 domain-containing protein [Roseomonas fluvialis]BDG71095.1 hypothetical protein Rmf_10240 [Roseomonas fluvialis]